MASRGGKLLDVLQAKYNEQGTFSLLDSISRSVSLASSLNCLKLEVKQPTFALLLPPRWTAAVPRDVSTTFGIDKPSSAFYLQAFLHTSFNQVVTHPSRKLPVSALTTSTMNDIAPIGKALLRMYLLLLVEKACGGEDIAERNGFKMQELMTAANEVLAYEGMAHLLTSVWRLDQLILADHLNASIVHNAFGRRGREPLTSIGIVPVPVCATCCMALVAAIYVTKGLEAAEHFMRVHVITPRLYAIAASETNKK